MKIIKYPSEFRDLRSAVAIGKFDGVHLGHRKLLNELVKYARENGLPSVVFTFDPPPAVLFGGAEVSELSTVEEKRAVFEIIGIDVLVEFPFNRVSAAILPEDFIRSVLVRDLRCAAVFCGADVSFGAGGMGGLRLLTGFSGELGYSVHVVDKLCAGGLPISSTRIRQAFSEGRTREAMELLGAGEV